VRAEHAFGGVNESGAQRKRRAQRNGLAQQTFGGVHDSAAQRISSAHTRRVWLPAKSLLGLHVVLCRIVGLSANILLGLVVVLGHFGLTVEFGSMSWEK